MRTEPAIMAWSEAEDRYLAVIGDDCASILGRGIELMALECDAAGEAVRLIARYRLGDRVWLSAATGESLLAAHAALRVVLTADRIRLGFTELVEGP
jgi:hypothetical protein